jgi:hypothetical protein
MQLMHHEPPAMGPQEHELIFSSCPIPPHTDSFHALHRIGQQLVRARASFVWPEITRPVDVQKIDRFRGNEFQQIYSIRLFRTKRRYLFVRNFDVLLLGIFEAARRV